MKFIYFIVHFRILRVYSRTCIFSVYLEFLWRKSQLLHPFPDKYSSLGYVPTSVIKPCSSVFSEIISTLANLSFPPRGVFPSSFKHAAVRPLLKKPNRDPSIPSNYTPLSNLNNISKLLEKLFSRSFTSSCITSGNFIASFTARKHLWSTYLTTSTTLLTKAFHTTAYCSPLTSLAHSIQSITKSYSTVSIPTSEFSTLYIPGFHLI